MWAQIWKELEANINQIKMSVLLSKRDAKQAEEKKNEIKGSNQIAKLLLF